MIFCARRELQARLKIEQLSCSARNYEIHSRKRAWSLFGIKNIFDIFILFYWSASMSDWTALVGFLTKKKFRSHKYLYLVNKKIQVRAPITAFRFHILSFFYLKAFLSQCEAWCIGCAATAVQQHQRSERELQPKLKNQPTSFSRVMEEFSKKMLLERPIAVKLWS